MDLVDREGTMIQATAFGSVAEKLDGIIFPNKIYTFAGGKVQMANRKFTPIKNEYCIVLGFETIVQECIDDSKRIAQSGFSFTGLAEIEYIIAPCAVDVIAVILEVQSIE